MRKINTKNIKYSAAASVLLLLIVLNGCGGEKKTHPPLSKDPPLLKTSKSYISKPSGNYVSGTAIDVEITMREQPAEFDSIYIKVDGIVIYTSREMKPVYTAKWRDTAQKVGMHVVESALILKNGKNEFQTGRFFTLSDITPTEYTYSVVNSYPHDMNAYTQGLEFSNGKLYEGTGQYGESQLREVDLLTGNAKKITALDKQYFGEGITIMGDKIFQLTYKSKIGFVYNKNTFNKLEEFTYDTEGWGLAHDDKYLILSDGTSFLYFLDPVTFKKKRQIEVCDNVSTQMMLNELEYVNGEIWANVYLSDIILRIDPKTGKVLGRIIMSGIVKPEDHHAGADVMNGIAYDPNSNRIYVTGKNWKRLYEIEVRKVES